MKTEIELDFLGDVYATKIKDESAGTFNLTVYFKEEVNTAVLQQAVDELVKECPYLSGRLTSRGTYELLTSGPIIQFDEKPHEFPAYYKVGKGHMFRVLYGERHIRIEATHVIVDGRGLTQITKALVHRYLRLLGVLTDEGHAPELVAFDAYKKYADETTLKKEAKGKKIKAYRHEKQRKCEPRTIVKQFDAVRIKEEAKVRGLTVGEYVMTHLLLAIKKERDVAGVTKPITVTIPTDLRTFFDASTIRNFIDDAAVGMPEVDDFDTISGEIKKTLALVNKEEAQNKVNEFARTQKSLRGMPMWLRKFLIHQVMKNMYKSVTTMFTNLGVIKFPEEVAEHIDCVSFNNSQASELPYIFSCITFGNTLALSVTTTIEENLVLDELFKRLED